MLLNKTVSLCKFWFRGEQIPVSGKVNPNFIQKRKSESPNAVVQDVPHNTTIMSDVINGWHDYCLNPIRQRNFTDVSQPENAKNCCVVPKIEELQPLVFLQMGGAPQQWKSAAREFLNPKLPGRWIGWDAPNPRLPPSLTLSFWMSYLELYEGQVHRSDTSTRSTLRHQTYRRVWRQKWKMTWCDGRQHRSSLPINFIPEGTKYGKPSHFIFSDLVSEHVF